MTTTGSVFKAVNPSGKIVWKVELTVGTRPDGSRRAIRRTAHSKREAEQLRLRLLTQLNEGLLGETSFKRLDDFALWWIREVRAREIKISTASDYESRYRAHIRPVFGHRPLSSITALDITEWLFDLKRAGLSDSTQNGALQLLKMIFKAAVAHREIGSSPAASIPRLKNPRQRNVQEPWNREEALAAIAASKSTELELPILFGIHLGLRIGEILGLKWHDLDVENGSVTIQRSIREIRQFNADGSSYFSLEESTPKTSAGMRKIALTYDLQSALLSHRERLQRRGTFDSDGWVMAARSIHPMRPNRLAKLYRKFLVEHGLRRIRFHDLRHTSAVLGLEAGIRIEAVSQTLGHSKIDTTKTIYAPAVDTLSREHAEGVQDFLTPLNIATSPTRERRQQ